MFDAFDRSAQRRLKAFAIKRFQQVIHSVHFESAQSELIVSGNEYNYRRPFRVDGLENAKTVEFRHLDIEKHQIGRLLLDSSDSLASIRALPDEINLRLVLEQLTEALARQSFVINDQRSNIHAG
jgi:hypothetical protein